MSESVSADPSARAAIWREVLGLYLVTLLLIKAVVALQATFALPADVLVAVPALFIYAPVFWLRRKGLDPYDFGLNLDRVGAALRFNAMLLLLIIPPFVLGNHYFQQLVFHRQPVGLLPKDLLSGVVLYHLFFVGFPEECFYRGYMQSRLNPLFLPRWTLFGVRLGWAWPLTALLFTVGHSIVVPRWWHFSILFPALLFGWIREKTGNVVAGAIFHASCNILMVLLDTWYGVIPP